MKIIVDGFGGDRAPIDILKGCAKAVEEYYNKYHVDIIVTGNEKIIQEEAKKNNINLDHIKIINAPSILPVCEDPTQILKKYSDSSMAVGLSLLSKGEGDAFISAGSTGGLIVGSSLIVKRIKNIKRAALATIIPTNKNAYMLIDSGANHDCRPEMLAQFALMGSVYMNKVLNINNPRVGLLNIGTEENKGTQTQREAYNILKDSSLNFVGNIEAREIPFNIADVVVSDGFVGNIVLKYTEGIAKFFMSEIKNIINKNILTKLAGSVIYGGLKSFKNKLDYTEYGGAILLGIKKPVIKAHGSSNDKAIKNAIKQAIKIVQNKTVQEISQGLDQYNLKNNLEK
ncbi:MAG: phosphate acyltransferase PlsX [Oscillospiraceae bacterium]|nr:phosphate acyltransferase PlsX [Oscillospiraceae bacterium]